MKSKILFISLAVVLALSVSVGLIGCTPTPTGPPDYIEILAVRSLDGPLLIFEQTAMGPIYKLWNHVVNDVSGGIYVPEFAKKIPVRITVKNDNSDLATMKSLLQTNLATGKYKFAIGPDCTPFLEAAGPICSQYGVVLVGAEGGATAVAQEMDKYPYMFSNLAFSDWYQVPELCKLMDAWSAAETVDGEVDVYVMYLNDQFGFEYRNTFAAWADNYTTIDIIKEVSMTPFTEEVAAQVNEATTMGADVVCIFAYPPTPMAVVGYAAATSQNFKGVVTGPAACYEGFYDVGATPAGFGDVALGVSGFGAWNEYSTTGLRTFTENFVDYHGRALLDWWGGAQYYTGLQMLEKAIAAATTYDALAVRGVMASQKLDTILGETYYTTYDGTWPIGSSGGLLAIAAHAGEVGQWQEVTAANDWEPDGNLVGARLKPYGIAGNATEWAIFEVISLDHPTSDWIYPKQNWDGTPYS